MTDILFHIDERDFATGAIDGPYLMIRRRRGPGATIEAQGNARGFGSHTEQLLEHGVNGIAGDMNAIIPLIEVGDLGKRLTHLSLGDYDDDGLSYLSKLPNLTALMLGGAGPKRPLGNVVPKLSFLTVGKMQKTTLGGLAQLHGLQLTAGCGHLDTCESPGLKTLFVAGATPQCLDHINRFQQLQTLALWSRKKGWSFTALTQCPLLNDFAFEGPAHQYWDSLPQTLKRVSIEKTNGSARLADHLSDVPVLSIGYNPTDSGDDGFYRGDLLEVGDPFRTIEGDVFMSDIV